MTANFLIASIVTILALAALGMWLGYKAYTQAKTIQTMTIAAVLDRQRIKGQQIALAVLRDQLKAKDATNCELREALEQMRRDEWAAPED